MVKTMKKVAKIVAIIAVVWLLSGIAIIKKCNDSRHEPTKNGYLLPTGDYQPPIVKVPFLTKDRAPVSKKNLPIRKGDVKTTIVVKNPVPGGKDITIIIDKKGKVYKSKDTPEDVKIQVTEWKPALFGLQSKWGIGITMDIPPDLSVILSWDVIRAWKLHFGLDVGMTLADQATEVWLGVSVKFKILKNNNLFMLVGYNVTQDVPYVGVSMRF
jgi:hypothetical protein